MGDFQPPAGPPPPKVPAGWKAVWNDQYKEWFFVNTFTKASQWDKPTEPVYGPGDDVAPQGPPPAYHGDTSQRPPEKGGFANNNPYGGAESDEALARRLQQEENRRVQGHGASAANRGEADSFYTAGPAQQYGASSSSGAYPGPAQAPPPDTGSGSKGLLSKLTGKLGGSSRPPQGYGQPPPHQYGGYPPQGYPPQQYGGYPPQPQYVKKQRLGGGGMGALGGAGLGLGAGMLGGAMLGSAMDGHDGGYHGGDDGGYGGDDGGYGGGDGGGFGGDDGGGDFGGDGGGDFGGD